MSKINNYLSVLGFLLLVLQTGYGQSVPAGFSFQAALNDQNGLLMSNQEVQLRIALTNAPPFDKTYFVENHITSTNELGIFSIVIGQGGTQQNLIERVPWAAEEIWLSIDLLVDNSYKKINQGALLAVPYAFHAETANKLATGSKGSVDLRDDQNIVWNTRGNFKTEPDVHFLGTIDEKDLYFKSNDTTRMVITSDGQTTFYTDPDITGKDSEIDSYPVIINGGRQGLYIQIEEERDNTNNFMAFADPKGIHGAVEGQTVGEFFASFEFKYFIATNTADVVLGGINGALGVVESGGMAAAGKPGAAFSGKKEILKGIFEEIRFKLFRIAKFITQNVVNIGVYYKSGSADYAEWLERNPNEDPMIPGEIVGIKAGKITRNTIDADQLFVISRSPIVLGNMPQIEEQDRFEKVAMKGQVQVLCVGEINIGDFILPSGNNDGMAIGVSPENMKIGDYNRIVGVAWQDSREAPINRINVAVGINQNDLADKIEKLDNQLVNIQDYLKGDIGLEELRTDNIAKSSSKTQRPNFEQSTLSTQLSNAQYDQVIDLFADNYLQIFQETEELLRQEGTNVADIPYLKTMFENPIAYLKSLRRDPRMKTHMGFIDQAIINSKILEQKN